MRVTSDGLRQMTGAILRSGGSETREAELVADHLVLANLAGHDSHGVGMVPAYVRHWEAGLVVPNTRAKLTKDDGAILMLRRNDSAFRLSVNRVLAGLYRSGDVVPIYEKWFGSMSTAGNLIGAMYLINGLPE